MNQKLEILATPFDDPSICRFTIGITSLVENEITFYHSPDEDFFIRDLFEVEEIKQIVVDKNYIICKKDSETPWSILAKTVGNIIRLAHQNNRLVIPNLYRVEKVQESEPNSFANLEFINSDLGQKMKEVIELQIQPSLGAHGGSVTLLDFKDGHLFVRFQGGCQGCSQASVTVKDGIQKILKSKFPEIVDVVDLTDHLKGQNPYFK